MDPAEEDFGHEFAGLFRGVAAHEHKICYRFRGAVPPNLLSELTNAAEAATHLDETTEGLHRLVDHTSDPDEVS
ncbi:hypothetical protein [Actinophytocola xinjiangensis]|uniref:hypothetical protein n=1 Tax=Actinophytocola xinjiangensis TaxID=485602 RepID=UPI0012B8D6B0|nr:hypothetical protein [Actinophytocola xinjiangensis]